MAFAATVYGIFIASPGDCRAEREAIADAILRWNLLYSALTGVVMLPIRWEVDAVPGGGADPQNLINNQLLERSDILVVIFRESIGRTGGTVAEINFYFENDREKRIMLYVHDSVGAPAVASPQSLELAQYIEDIETKLLISRFKSPEQLCQLVGEHLTRRANATLAAGPLQEMWQTLGARLEDWREIEAVPEAVERAYELLCLVEEALRKFDRRTAGRPLPTVDGRVYQCMARVALLTRDHADFVRVAPWAQVQAAIADIVDFRSNLPGKEELL